jgi:hypothetical protein
MSTRDVRAESGRSIARELARILSEDRWVPAAAHIVLLVIVILHAGWGLPRSFLLAWAAAILATILLRTVLAGRAQRDEIDPASAVRLTRVIMVALGLAWGVGAALAARFLPPAVFAMLLMALARLLAGGINTLVADRFVRERTDAEFSHGLCPDCAARDWGNVKTS